MGACRRVPASTCRRASTRFHCAAFSGFRKSAAACPSEAGVAHRRQVQQAVHAASLHLALVVARPAGMHAAQLKSR